MPAPSYELRLHDNPARLPATEWNALLEAQAAPTPFMRHEYLAALHESGSATSDTGWTPCFMELRHEGALAGACPLYLKTHSYGEYVFDWAWANAYERHGLDYYPKLLCAVPFTPVPGSRLLAIDDAARTALLQGMRQVARQEGLSSVHLLFGDGPELGQAEKAQWLLRSSVQFHWQNRDEPFADFGEFLASLQRDKRKKIQQERRRVVEAGASFSVHEGDDITEALWDFFHRCYLRTYREHHSTPYLTRDFFARMAGHMAAHWVMFVARREGRPIGASLIAVDRTQRVAYGRYWGALERVPLLHFEACYYQPLQWCIDQRFLRFEGGAQGEHKLARGLLPTRTGSAHWLAHPRFQHAVADFLQREGAGVGAYLDELNDRNPFKAP